jgi:hypothetical protein
VGKGGDQSKDSTAMRRVMIVNRCGLLSAMPTLKEFEALAFTTKDKYVGEVEVSDKIASMIHQESTNVRVLLPGLPKPRKREGWRYVSVVKGEVVLVEHQKISMDVQKSRLANKGFRRYLSDMFTKIGKFFEP